LCEAIRHRRGVTAAQFHPNGLTMAFGSGKQLWFARMPHPAEDAAERIALSVEVRTASAIRGGVVRVLSESELTEKRRWLAALGGGCPELNHRYPGDNHHPGRRPKRGSHPPPPRLRDGG